MTLVRAFNAHSLSGLQATACSGSRVRVSQAVLDGVKLATLTGTPVVSGSTAVAAVTIEHYASASEFLTVKLKQEAGAWCTASF